MEKNLVVIMADQLRYDVLNKGFTPNIDKLFSDGIVFDNAYCACPLCVPSRGAFFTGLCPNTNGSLINPWEPKDAVYGDVKKEFDNLYTLMENNWYSIHSGKQHFFTEGGKLEDVDKNICWASTEKSYKAFLKENGKRQPGTIARYKTHVPEMVNGRITKVAKYSNAETGVYPEDQRFFFDRYFADRAVEELKNRDKSKPLFLSAMFLAPHPPLEIPEPWFSAVKSEDVVLPENVGVYYEYQSPLQMYNLTGIVGSHYSLEHWKEAWRVYLGLVSMLDDCVGAVIDELKAQGIYDDSFIIFTSDHGEMLGSHRLFQKMCMYQESAKVPLCIKLPNGSSSAIKYSDRVVSHLDIMPTIADYLSLDSKNSFEGKSLRNYIETGDESGLADKAFIQFDGNGARSNFQRAIVSGDYKLILDLFKDEYFLELYNVKTDPMESRNLAFESENDSRLESLYNELAEHMEKTGDLIVAPKINLDEFRLQHKDFKINP